MHVASIFNAIVTCVYSSVHLCVADYLMNMNKEKMCCDWDWKIHEANNVKHKGKITSRLSEVSFHQRQ